MDAQSGPAPLLRRMKLLDVQYHFAVVGQSGAVEFIYNKDESSSWLSFHKPTPVYNGQCSSKCLFFPSGCYGDFACEWAVEHIVPLFNTCNASFDFEPLWLKLEEIQAEHFASSEVAQ